MANRQRAESFSDDEADLDRERGKAEVDNLFGGVGTFTRERRSEHSKRGRGSNKEMEYEAMGRDKNGFAVKKEPSQSKKVLEKAEPTKLTFVDMSKLKYLSKSVAGSDSKLSRHQAPIKLPSNVNTAILEAPSEEDEEEEDPSAEQIKPTPEP